MSQAFTLLPPLAQAIGSVAAAWTALTGVVTAVAAWRHSRAGRPPEAPAPSPPRALVLRPCAGIEVGLADNLMSATALRRDTPQALVHLVEAGDGAWSTAERTANTLRSLGLAARTVSTTPEGANHKAAQLANHDGLAQNFATWVCIDSDVRIDAQTLAAVCAPLQDPKVGAAWLPFAEAGPPLTWGDRCSQAVLSGSLHAFALLGHLDRRGFVGKVCAMRPAALADVGGWQSVAHCLGEDMAMGARLRAAGWQVRTAGGMAYAVAKGRRCKDVCARHARWLRVIRWHRPLTFCTYPILFFPTACLSALWLSAGWVGMPPGVCLVGILACFGVRVATALAARHASGLPLGLVQAMVDVCVAEVVLSIAFVQALGGRYLTWRGRRLRVGRRGIIAICN